jgi:hypothetical protein
LSTLLRYKTPQLHPGTFAGGNVPVGLTPIAAFREGEGPSAIVALD